MILPWHGGHWATVPAPCHPRPTMPQQCVSSQGVWDHRRRGHRPPCEHQLPRCESLGCPQQCWGGHGEGGHMHHRGLQICLPGWSSRGCAQVCFCLGRRRWRRRGRCCGRSPSSSACASPSPSTSMAPVSGDGRDVVSLSLRTGTVVHRWLVLLSPHRTVHRGFPAVQQGGLRAGSAAEEVRAETWWAHEGSGWGGSQSHCSAPKLVTCHVSPRHPLLSTTQSCDGLTTNCVWAQGVNGPPSTHGRCPPCLPGSWACSHPSNGNISAMIS